MRNKQPTNAFPQVEFPEKWSLQCQIVDVDAVPTMTSKVRVARVASKIKDRGSAAMNGGEERRGDGSARSENR